MVFSLLHVDNAARKWAIVPLSWFLRRYILLRFSKFLNDTGTDPVNPFPNKSIWVSSDRLPMDSGISPVIWLLAKLKYTRFVSCPSSAGILPSSLFSLRSKPASLVWLHSSIGIFPVMSFVDKYIIVRLGSVASHDGTVPVKLGRAFRGSCRQRDPRE